MQNISKIINKNVYLFINLILFCFLIFSSYADASTLNKTCEGKNPHQKKDQFLITEVCSSKGNILKLKYNEKSGKIWIDSDFLNEKENIIAHFKKGESPELIGAKDDIGILFNKTITIGQKEFLAIVYSKRSNEGNGGGQCGAGEEIYLTIYEITKNSIHLSNNLLVASCNSSIDLDVGDGSENGKKNPFELDGESIKIKWLSYPGYENSVTGNFNIRDNKIYFPSK